MAPRKGWPTENSRRIDEDSVIKESYPLGIKRLDNEIGLSSCY